MYAVTCFTIFLLFPFHNTCKMRMYIRHTLDFEGFG